MSKTGLIDKLTLDAIGDAIRSKDKSTDLIPVNALADRIKAIPSVSGKLPQIIDRTVTELTAEDLAGVTKIGTHALNYCNKLICVTIPDGVTSIGSNALNTCTRLKSVTIPSSVTSIDNGAFTNDHSIIEVVNNSSLNITKGATTYGNIALNALEVHSGESKVVAHGDYRFYTYDGVNYLIGCTETDTELILPENYNGENYAIYKYAFYIDDNITSVTIPNSVTSIGEYAFLECASITSVTIGNGVTSIDYYAFGKCNIRTSVTIPDSVTSIDSYAFGFNDRLPEVRIGNGITSIGDKAFNYCSRLKDIYIDAPEDSISGAPWGATNATIHWNTPLPTEED